MITPNFLNLFVLIAFLIGLSLGIFLTAIWYKKEPNINESKPLLFDETDIYHPQKENRYDKITVN